MKVLLKEDVDNLGYAGEVHNVADGYGRNYLLPRGLAVLATEGVLKQASAWRARAEARRAELRSEYEALNEKINGTHLVFHARAGETGRLYGSVTMMDVAERLNEELGVDIDRRKFDSQPLRDLGEHRITIHLDREFHPQVVVNVHPETDGDTGESTEADVDAQEDENAVVDEAGIDYSRLEEDEDEFDEFDEYEDYDEEFDR